MIDKQTQDRSWKCLPKEVRAYFKYVYKSEYVYDRGHQPTRIMELLIFTFGNHNLTSDAELEEVLVVPRKTICEMYATNQRIMTDFRGKINGINADLINHMLRQLFGSKCLPDELEQGLEQTSVQVEESEAEPTTQTNDNMEEKELNLGEILKDYIGDTFFHPHYGDVEVEKVTSFIFLRVGDGTTLSIPKTDCLYATGMAFLYPDAESLKKYPFDGKVAWQEFVEANKPTYKIQGILQIFEDGALVDEIDLPDVDFKSLDLAQQAAEAVKKCLEDFHSKLNQQ